MQRGRSRNQSRNRFLPSVAPLENRQMLSGVATDYAIQGDKWNSPAITYSIVPDGTDWQGHPSDLNAEMAAKVGPAWEAQVDRALATWAAAAGLTFTKVADDGEPEGTDGKNQSDSRFGDIRIGGYDFENQTILAQTYGPSNSTTLGGDISVNSAFDWASGRDIDLYSVALHESGHAIGLGHASDPGDVMYPQYTGVASGLGIGDIAGAQSLYGPPAGPTPSPAPPVVTTPATAPVPSVAVVPKTPAQRRAANRAARQQARQQARHARRLAQQQARQHARAAARAKFHLTNQGGLHEQAQGRRRETAFARNMDEGLGESRTGLLHRAAIFPPHPRS